MAKANRFLDLVAWYRALGEFAPNLDDELANAAALHNPVLVGGRMITLCHSP
jgi:hypothetical protein